MKYSWRLVITEGTYRDTSGGGRVTDVGIRLSLDAFSTVIQPVSAKSPVAWFESPQQIVAEKVEFSV